MQDAAVNNDFLTIPSLSDPWCMEQGGMFLCLLSRA